MRASSLPEFMAPRVDVFQPDLDPGAPTARRSPAPAGRAASLAWRDLSPLKEVVA